MRKQPNILVIMADDHGQWASNGYGTRELITPAMDYLAKSGVTMTNAFTPCPVCSPARACFFTGTLPSAHGIHDWLAEYGVGSEHPGLDRQTNIAQLLRTRGYQTALIGKWHCGDSRTPKPGFDYWFSFWQNQYPHSGKQSFSDNGVKRIEDGDQTTLLCDHAIDYLKNKRKSGKPFFLFTSFVDTHSPFSDHPDRWVAKYRKCSFRDIPNEETASRYHPIQASLQKNKASIHERLSQYYAAVSMIDEAVGRLIETLTASGELENTLIVYTSDHGHMNGHHGLYGKGNATRPQNFFEESIHVPCLLSWPEVLPAGVVRNEPVDHCDLFCTVLDAAGQNQPPDEMQHNPMPSQSYLPLLTNQLHDWRNTQFCEYGPARMIRTDRYKLILHYPTARGRFDDALYDLHSDPRENMNRIGDASLVQVRDSLALCLEKHFAEHETREHSGLKVDDQPTHNSDQAWDPLPQTTVNT